MKKRINGKIKNGKRKMISIIIILIFLLYICLALTVSNRRYLYVESIFKTISSNLNGFFIDNGYSSSTFSSNIINSRIKYLEKENDALKEILNITNKEKKYVVAKVVNHTSKTWFDKVGIDKGYVDGITKELPVISGEGLIGFITKVGKNISEVKLLTSINDKNLISVTIETKSGSIAGVLSDYDVKNGLFKVSDVTSKESVTEGDFVLLSGYDNESYKGIYVGSVVKEESGNYGLSRTIWVESSVNFDDLMFVLVPTLEDE